VRVPKAGGTLFKVEAVVTASSNGSRPQLSDSSLLLLADILPTGVFAAVQALNHAKLSPMLSAKSYPFSAYVPASFIPDEPANANLAPLSHDDRALTFAVVGLGPVGVVSDCHIFRDHATHTEF
jgi:hypothetical protein